MSDPLSKHNAGDKLEIGASSWNEFCDAARFARSHKHPVPQPFFGNAPQTGLVRIKNSSGSALSRFGVLGISGVAINQTDNADEFYTNPTLTGVTPDADDHFQKFAVAVEPIADGATGYAVVSGLVQCQINVLHASHPFADVRDGYATMLESGLWGGSQILWKDTGTGTKWALVNIGITGGWSYLGKLDGQLDAGSSATVSIWTGSTPSDSGINVTAYDWFLPSGNIASGKKVLVEYFPHNKKPYVTAAEC